MSDKPKVMIMWQPKTNQDPEVAGLATEVMSARTINDLARMARADKGKLYIIEANTDDDALFAIRSFEGKNRFVRFDMVAKHGNVAALGHRAVVALGGAGYCVRHWQRNSRAYGGRIPAKQTIALLDTPEDLERISEYNIFEGFRFPLGDQNGA